MSFHNSISLSFLGGFHAAIIEIEQQYLIQYTQRHNQFPQLLDTHLTHTRRHRGPSSHPLVSLQRASHTLAIHTQNLCGCTIHTHVHFVHTPRKACHIQTHTHMLATHLLGCFHRVMILKGHVRVGTQAIISRIPMRGIGRIRSLTHGRRIVMRYTIGAQNHMLLFPTGTGGRRKVVRSGRIRCGKG